MNEKPEPAEKPETVDVNAVSAANIIVVVSRAVRDQTFICILAFGLAVSPQKLLAVAPPTCWNVMNGNPVPIGATNGQTRPLTKSVSAAMM